MSEYLSKDQIPGVLRDDDFIRVLQQMYGILQKRFENLINSFNREHILLVATDQLSRIMQSKYVEVQKITLSYEQKSPTEIEQYNKIIERHSILMVYTQFLIEKTIQNNCGN